MLCGLQPKTDGERQTCLKVAQQTHVAFVLPGASAPSINLKNAGRMLAASLRSLIGANPICERLSRKSRFRGLTVKAEHKKAAITPKHGRATFASIS